MWRILSDSDRRGRRSYNRSYLHPYLASATNGNTVPTAGCDPHAVPEAFRKAVGHPESSAVAARFDSVF